MWHGPECFLRCGAQGRSSFYLCDAGSFEIRVCASGVRVGAAVYSAAETIHLVMNNLSHRRKSLTGAFGVELGGELGTASR